MDTETIPGSRTVFTLIPNEYHEFAVVVDKDKPEDTRRSWKKKFPGGGVEPPNENLKVAAGIEVYQEIGLRGIDPYETILEVHKISRENATLVHTDFFFLSRAISKNSLTPGEDIEYAGWETSPEIVDTIRNRGFVKSHASAFLWLYVRDDFLRTRDSELIQTILNDRDLFRWSWLDKKLTLCFSPWCRSCPKEKNTHLMPSRKETALSFPSTLQKEKPACMAVTGKAFFVILHGNKFDDHVLLQNKKQTDVFLLPSWTFQEKTEKEDVLRFLESHFGGEYEWISCKNLDGKTVIALRLLSGVEAVPILIPICINRSPQILFTMPLEDWESFSAVVPTLETYFYPSSNQRPVINHNWKYWHDRVHIERLAQA